MRVVADMLDGAVRLSSDAQGDTARRVFLVTEVVGSSAGRLASAARAAGIPVIGDAHPVLNGLTARNVVARATDDPGVVRVEVDYAAPGTEAGLVSAEGTDVTIQSSLITEQTTRDVDGNFLRTTWTFRFTSTDPGDASGTRRVNEAELSSAIHRVEVQIPTYSVTFNRVEASAPYTRARAYSGTVNASAFLGEPADRWLCTVSSRQQGPGKHLVTYAFTFNRSTWQAVLTHTIDGTIPADLTADGVVVKQVYPRANFQALGLPRL